MKICKLDKLLMRHDLHQGELARVWFQDDNVVFLNDTVRNYTEFPDDYIRNHTNCKFVFKAEHLRDSDMLFRTFEITYQLNKQPKSNPCTLMPYEPLREFGIKAFYKNKETFNYIDNYSPAVEKVIAKAINFNYENIKTNPINFLPKTNRSTINFTLLNEEIFNPIESKYDSTVETIISHPDNYGWIKGHSCWFDQANCYLSNMIEPNIIVFGPNSSDLGTLMFRQEYIFNSIKIEDFAMYIISDHLFHLELTPE